MGRLRRKKLIIPLLIVLIVVIGLLTAFIVLTGGTMSIDSLKRKLNYMGEEKNDEGMVGEIKFVSHTNYAADQYASGLIIASRTGVEIIDESGEETLVVSSVMSNPDITVVGERALAYDVGGTNYAIIDGGFATVQREAENNIISASMNSAGWVAVATEQSSYKATVYVYDSEDSLVMQQNISSGYVTDVTVSSDCMSLLVGMCAYEEDFVSKVVAYSLKGEETKEFVIRDELILAVNCFPGGGICAVTEQGAHFISENLENDDCYGFGSAYLKNFTFSAGDKCVLLLKDYETGSTGRVVVLSDSGSLLGEGEIDSEVVAMSAKGRYVAVLCYDKLEIYKDNMHLYGQTEDMGSAVDIIMREDGSVLMLSYDSAQIYLP